MSSFIKGSFFIQNNMHRERVTYHDRLRPLIFRVDQRDQNSLPRRKCKLEIKVQPQMKDFVLLVCFWQQR